MQLDRAAFLAWTAVLAGCPSPKEPTAAADVDAGIQPAPKRAFDRDAPEDPYAIDVGAEFPGPTKESMGIFRPKVGCDVQGWIGANGTMRKSPFPGGVPVYGKEGAACFDAWPCEGTDDVGRPPRSCKDVMSPCQEGDAPRGECARTRMLLKPRVAARAIECMDRVNRWLCDGDLDRACRELALVRACDDPTADLACDAIAGKCPSSDARTCRAYLSGLTDAGRSAMIKCMKTRCDVSACADALDGGG